VTVMDLEPQSITLPRYTAAEFLSAVSTLLGTDTRSLRQSLHEGEFLSEVLGRSGISAAELRRALADGPHAGARRTRSS
jgi:hypothetical protein